MGWGLAALLLGGSNSGCSELVQPGDAPPAQVKIEWPESFQGSALLLQLAEARASSPGPSFFADVGSDGRANVHVRPAPYNARLLSTADGRVFGPLIDYAWPQPVELRPGHQMQLVLPVEALPVRILLGGETPDLGLILRVRHELPDGNNMASFVEPGAAEALVWALGVGGHLQIEPLALLNFLALDVPLPSVPPAAVDLGPLRLQLLLRSSIGKPLTRRSIVVQEATGAQRRARSTSDSDGIALFFLRAGRYEIRVGGESPLMTIDLAGDLLRPVTIP